MYGGEKGKKKKEKLAPSLPAFLHRSLSVSCGYWNNNVHSECRGPLMSLHSPSRLKPEEKREGEKDAGEILWCAFSLPLSISLSPSLSLARHLTSPGKRQIRFRLLSRQSKLRKSFFFPPLSCSLSLCLFLSVSLSLSLSRSLYLLHFRGCGVVKAAYTLFKQ